MSEKPVVGFVGVGLMGWGMAKNAVEKGYPLRVIAHRKREAVDDLVARGARRGGDPRRDGGGGRRDRPLRHRLAGGRGDASPSSCRAARPGLTIIDSSTSDPEVTERLAAELAGRRASRSSTRRCRARRRTPGRASSRPSSAGRRSSWRSGGRCSRPGRTRSSRSAAPVGSAHALKLINNLVALGYAAIWSECYAMVAQDRRRPGGLPRGGVELGDELRQLPELRQVSRRRRPERPQVHASPTPSRTSATTTASPPGTRPRR